MTEENENERPQEPEREDGAVTVKAGAHSIYCLTVIGQIEGHYALPPQEKATRYEHIIPRLVAAEQSPDVEGVLLLNPGALKDGPSGRSFLLLTLRDDGGVETEFRRL